MQRQSSAAVLWAPNRPAWLSPDLPSELTKASQRPRAGRSKTIPTEPGNEELWKQDEKAAMSCAPAAALGSTFGTLRMIPEPKTLLLLDASLRLLSPRGAEPMIFLRFATVHERLKTNQDQATTA